MTVFSLGINHQTAPISFREQVAGLMGDLSLTNASLSQVASLEEVITISTCNRVEIYGVGPNEHSVKTILEWLKSSGVDIREQYFYCHLGQDAVSHLFRVVSSLDSMILGENQIIAQVRSAFHTADGGASVGPILRRIFEKAFMVAKKVRTQTKISEGAVSIGRAGVDLANQVLGDMSGKTAMIVGAGEHGQLIANNLKNQGLSELYIANRTMSRAVSLAEELGALPLPLSDIHRYLSRCDVIVGSIGGGQQVIHRKDVENAIRKRRYKPLVFMDLSVPRVFDRSIHELNDAYLFDVDDLQSITHQGMDKRKREAEQAEAIVKDESTQCWAILHVDQHNHTIGQVFQNSNQIISSELQRLSHQHDWSDAELSMIEKALSSVANKVLHNPIQHAKNLGKVGDSRELQRYLQTLLPEKER